MLYLAIQNIINLAIRNLKGRVYMEYVEQNPLSEVCLRCEDRAGCLARGEGEWCCEECEHLLERFLPREPQK